MIFYIPIYPHQKINVECKGIYRQTLDLFNFVRRFMLALLTVREPGSSSRYYIINSGLNYENTLTIFEKVEIIPWHRSYFYKEASFYKAFIK